MRGEHPARGKALFAPLNDVVENALILVRNGKIVEISRAPRAFRHASSVDLGDACLIPAVANAHTHAQLSWLSGKTLWGGGFSAWLKSMLPSLVPVKNFSGLPALERAAEAMRRAGIRWIGDVGGSVPGALTAVTSALANFETTYFCEWFGGRDYPGPWPQRCAAEVAPGMNLAPAAHALYSTSPEILRKVRAWCRARGKPFSFHLAESGEEEEFLRDGSGPFREIYLGPALPPDWRPPDLTPLEYAIKLDLLGPGTLAVHGTRLDEGEIKIFAAAGASICLCPRSNRNLATGSPRVAAWLRSNALVCLGTDGLTSNDDLDVREEALYLRDAFDASAEALLRLLTVNGVVALGFNPENAVLRPGAPALFSLLPDDF